MALNYLEQLRERLNQPNDYLSRLKDSFNTSSGQMTEYFVSLREKLNQPRETGQSYSSFQPFAPPLKRESFFAPSPEDRLLYPKLEQ